MIVVDALDEAEYLASPSGANLLLLPRVLPLGIFIIATSRRETEEKMPLRIDIPEQMKRELRQDESGNKADIVEYIHLSHVEVVKKRRASASRTSCASFRFQSTGWRKDLDGVCVASLLMMASRLW